MIDQINGDNFDEAVKVFKGGGVVIFPTDTVWGIGCRLDDQNAVERVFRIRNRPFQKAVPVLVSSFPQAEKYFSDLPSEIKKLILAYWPGGLTVVYYASKQELLSQVRGGGETIGLRMPNKKDLLQMIERVGVPILGPSANFSGCRTPAKKTELDPQLIKQVDCVLDGECDGKMSSTVVDCTQTPWKILRQGAVQIEPARFNISL